MSFSEQYNEIMERIELKEELRQAILEALSKLRQG